MKKLFLIAGHSANDPGASGNFDSVGKVVEATLTKELRDLIASAFVLHNSNPVIKDDDKHNLTQVLNSIANQVHKDDIVIDIHFNAFNTKARGTEAFIPTVNSVTEKNLAKDIVEATSKLLVTPNRGVKTEKESNRGRLGFLHGTGNRILLEICFIDNKEDLESYLKNKLILASEIATLIEKYLK
jgi:N-acetylmuramoyl-L-alanine amidase